MIASVRTLRGLIFASHAGPTIAVTSIMAVLALGIAHPNPWGIALMVLTGQLSIGWSNDAIDAPRDLSNNRIGKPVVAGLVRPTMLWVCAVSALVVSVCVSYAVGGPVGGSAHVIAVLSAWMYNVGVKGTVFSPVPYAISFGLLPAVLTYSLQTPVPPALWATVVFALLGIGAHIANVLPDIDYDRTAGLRPLPLALGRRVSQIVAPAVLFAGTCVLALALPWSAPTTALVIVVMAAALVGASVWRGGERLFVVFLALAVVDAALVLSYAERLAQR